MTAWERLPGPGHYRPGDVEPALAALAAVVSEADATAACNRLLSAAGTSSRGSRCHA